MVVSSTSIVMVLLCIILRSCPATYSLSTWVTNSLRAVYAVKVCNSSCIHIRMLWSEGACVWCLAHVCKSIYCCADCVYAHHRVYQYLSYVANGFFVGSLRGYFEKVRLLFTGTLKPRGEQPGVPGMHVSQIQALKPGDSRNRA